MTAAAIELLKATRAHLVEHPELWMAGTGEDGSTRSACLIVRTHDLFARSCLPIGAEDAARTALDAAALELYPAETHKWTQRTPVLCPAAIVNDRLGRLAAIALCDHAIAALKRAVCVAIGAAT